MKLRILMLPLVALAWVNLVKGQGSAELKDSAEGEIAKTEVRALIGQFERALKTRDFDAIAPLYSDDLVWVSERFGRGENLSKAQVIDLFKSGKMQVASHTHDTVSMQAFGNSVVVVKGHSTSVLQYKGRLSKGPRLFTAVYAKQNGRWQLICQHISDIPNGDAPW